MGIYDEGIADIPDPSGITIDNDYTVYIKLIETADFDSTSRFPVPSAGAKYKYHLVSCFNGNIHVEPMQSRTSGSKRMRRHLTTQPGTDRYHPL